MGGITGTSRQVQQQNRHRRNIPIVIGIIDIILNLSLIIAADFGYGYNTGFYTLQLSPGFDRICPGEEVNIIRADDQVFVIRSAVSGLTLVKIHFRKDVIVEQHVFKKWIKPAAAQSVFAETPVTAMVGNLDFQIPIYD